MENSTTEVPVHVLVRVAQGQESSLISLRSYQGKLPPALRQQWGSHLINAFYSLAAQDKAFDDNDRSPAIRAWNVILSLDGSIESFALSHVVSSLPATVSATTDNKIGATIVPRRHLRTTTHVRSYPPRFRIPPAMIADLELEEQVGRAELFACGSVLYQIYNGGKEPFEGELEDDMSDDDNAATTQARFTAGDVPAALTTLPCSSWPMILACWSVEFKQELETLLPRTADGNDSSAPDPAQEPQPLLERAVCYAKAHPYLTALQASSALLSAFSFGAPLLLNIAGFSAAGPVAGTVAATWQSTMGVVKAGSLFSWCQSAAMGGTAAAGISTAGVVGSGVGTMAGVLGLLGSLSGETGVDDDVSREMLDRYKVIFRKGPVAGWEADGNSAE